MARDLEAECLAKAQAKGELTFTLRAQDRSAPKVILTWIMENFETCLNEDKLRDAFERALTMRSWRFRKNAD